VLLVFRLVRSKGFTGRGFAAWKAAQI